MRVTFHTHATVYDRAEVGSAVPPRVAIERLAFEIEHDGFTRVGGVVRIDGKLVGTFDGDGFHAADGWQAYPRVGGWVAAIGDTA